MRPEEHLEALFSGKLNAQQALALSQQELDAHDPNPLWALVACSALWMQERYEEGYELHRSFSSLLSDNGDAWLVGGLCARKLTGHTKQAEAALVRAIQLLPARADVYYNVGNFYNDLDDYSKSIPYYQKSLSLNNSSDLCWHNYGIALREQERLAEAATAMQNSIKLNPLNADVWCNLGLIAHANENFTLAKKYYLHSIQINQNYSGGWVNIGKALLEELKPEEALDALKEGHELNPESPEALFNMALTLLLLGEYIEGWRLYESRFTTKQFKDVNIPSSGKWIVSLEELQELSSNQTRCLVWSEQGLGDTIQFMRYLPILTELGVNFTFITRKSLLPLVKEWGPPGFDVYDERNTPSELHKAPHLALVSLPRLLRTSLNTIPSITPYLKAPGPPTEAHVISTPPGGISIGLVWASSPGNKALYKQKSMPLCLLIDRIISAVNHDLIELHSLQVGDDANALTPYLNIKGIHNWNGHLDHFGDTAHVVSQLDLVISVDTAVAHLAAALDLPTWVLLPSNADFRWLRDRSDSPWYGSMRLFRQPKRHDWAGAIDEVVDALGQVLGLDLDALAREKC